MFNLFSILGFGADVITVTTGTVGNAGNVAADLQTYFAAQVLEVAELRVVLDQFGQKVPVPSNSSKVIHFVREEKFAVATTPTQLTEGIAPEAGGITMNQFEATMEQYGALVRLSDLSELTAKHNVVERTIYLMGLQAAETYDQLIFNVLDAATNVYRPNSRVSDATLLGPDQLGYADMVALTAVMQDGGGVPMGGSEYVLVVCPQVHASLLKDPDFKASNQFAAPSKMWQGEVGNLAGQRIVRSNSPALAATTSAVSGQSNKVYSSFCIAENAYQISDLQNLQVYVVGPGGHTDPLQQSRLMGWKFAFKSIITNQAWLRRVRSSGANSVTNP